MTVEELLKPRYKVIADYPNSTLEVGFILYPDKDGKYYEYEDWGKWDVQPELYPHLFKKLEWWENRKEEDMPEYVKLTEEKNSITIIDGEQEPQVHKVKKHWAMNLSGDFRHSTYECFVSEWETHCYNYGQFLPATKEQYDNQNN